METESFLFEDHGPVEGPEVAASAADGGVSMTFRGLSGEVCQVDATWAAARLLWVQLAQVLFPLPLPVLLSAHVRTAHFSPRLDRPGSIHRFGLLKDTSGGHVVILGVSTGGGVSLRLSMDDARRLWAKLSGAAAESEALTGPISLPIPQEIVS